MSSIQALFLILLCHQTCSALNVVAPRAHNALIGSTTLVPCSFTVDSPPIQPQFLGILWHCGEKEVLKYSYKEKSSTPRMSVSEEEARQGNASLTIHNVTIADQGTYKCSIIYSPNREVKEIQLNIQAKPEITFLSSHAGDKKIFACQVKEFYPEDVKITWLQDGERMEPSRRNADGTYNTWDHVLITGDQKTGRNISCVVEHEALHSPVMKTLAVTDEKDTFNVTAVRIGTILGSIIIILLSSALFFIYKKTYFQRFQLSPIHIPDRWNENTDEKVTMFCMASNCPKKIQVRWIVEEQNGEKVEVPDQETQITGEYGQLLSRDYRVRTDQSEMDGLYNAITSLTFTLIVSKHRNMKVTCRFRSGSKTKEEDKEWSFNFNLPRRPVMGEIIVPSLVHGTEARIQCEIRGYFPKNLEVRWLRREAEKPELYEVSSNDKYKIPILEMTQEPDKTYTCTTSLIVSVSAVTHQGAEFICRVTHPSLETPLEKRTGELTVNGIPVVKKVLQNGRCIVLEIGSFSTQDITVTWEKANNQSGPYTVIEEKLIHNNQNKSHDGSFSFTSTLVPTVTTDIKKLTDKYFKATIKHEALKTPEEIVFFQSRGDVYILTGNEKKLL